MLTRKKIIEILKKEYSNLKDNFGVKKIAVFGSAAKDSLTQKSDVDIIVELEKPLGLAFVDLAEYLEKKIGRKVDILTIDGLKAIRIKEVSRRIRKSLLYV